MTIPITPRDVEGFRPDRHWSLWDIMRELLGKDFTFAINRLGQLQETANQEKTKQGPKAKVSPKHVNGLIKYGNILVTQFEILRADSSLRLLKALMDRGTTGKLTYPDLYQGAKTIDEVLRGELGGCYIFELGVKADYFAPQAPLFGPDVATKFGVITREINEAGKCYALGLHTACAFHLLRSLEAGIRALSRCLGIPDPTRARDRNWGNLLTTLKGEIDRRWPGSNTRMSGDGEFFDMAYAALAAMQNPYRNATMHFDQWYGEDDAKHIFEIVKGFMMKLANRMDENGRPLA